MLRLQETWVRRVRIQPSAGSIVCAAIRNHRTHPDELILLISEVLRLGVEIAQSCPVAHRGSRVEIRSCPQDLAGVEERRSVECVLHATHQGQFYRVRND